MGDRPLKKFVVRLAEACGWLALVEPRYVSAYLAPRRPKLTHRTWIVSKSPGFIAASIDIERYSGATHALQTLLATVLADPAVGSHVGNNNYIIFSDRERVEVGALAQIVLMYRIAPEEGVLFFERLLCDVPTSAQAEAAHRQRRGDIA